MQYRASGRIAGERDTELLDLLIRRQSRTIGCLAGLAAITIACSLSILLFTTNAAMAVSTLVTAFGLTLWAWNEYVSLSEIERRREDG